MSDKTARINAAIHECLEQCYGAPLPIACMAEYLIQLQSNPTWTESEIHEVETHVRQILTLIVEMPPTGRITA